MSADSLGENEDLTPVPDENPERPNDRRGAGIWALLAAVLLAAIVLLLLLTQCVPRVPDVVGLSEKQATAKLEDAGYKVGTVSTLESSSTPPGKVAEQAPPGGAVFARGRTVDLVVALGADLVAVPDVTGNDTPAAELLITGVDLVMKVEGEYSDTIPAGAIISQYPAPGTKVRVGSQVLVVVSLGIEPTVDTTGSTSTGSSSSSTSGGSGSSGSTASTCTASYPNASVWASGGDIYIRLTPGGGTRQLTSGSAWDSNPLLAPSGKYVVFMRSASNGSKVNQIGRVCLTDFSAKIITMPWSTQMTVGEVWYQDYRFAPSTTGTAPGSDWLVISQLYNYPTGQQDPNPAFGVRGRLVICNVPQASSWVSWNEAFLPTGGIALSQSSRAGCVRVNAIRPEHSGFVADFNPHTGMYFK